MKLNSIFLSGSTRETHYIVSKGIGPDRYIVRNNTVAAFIDEHCLATDMDEAAIVDAVIEEYNCPERIVVEKDVSAFLNDFEIMKKSLKNSGRTFRLCEFLEFQQVGTPIVNSTIIIRVNRTNLEPIL